MDTHMTMKIGLLVGLGIFPTLALAQGEPDALEACYQQPDGAPRLACFNQEMKRRQAADATANVGMPSSTPLTGPPPKTAAQPPKSAATANTGKAPEDTVGLQGSALRSKLTVKA
jgi:hypothetical protein